MTAGETITNIRRSQKSRLTRPDDHRKHHCAHGALAVPDRVFSYSWYVLLKNMLMYEPLVPWMCLCLEVIKVDLNSVWPHTYTNGNLDTGMWTREYDIWILGLCYFNQRNIKLANKLLDGEQWVPFPLYHPQKKAASETSWFQISSCQRGAKSCLQVPCL